MYGQLSCGTTFSVARFLVWLTNFILIKDDVYDLGGLAGIFLDNPTEADDAYLFCRDGLLVEHPLVVFNGTLLSCPVHP